MIVNGNANAKTGKKKTQRCKGARTQGKKKAGKKETQRCKGARAQGKKKAGKKETQSRKVARAQGKQGSQNLKEHFYGAFLPES
jgi:hypothetical protein